MEKNKLVTFSLFLEIYLMSFEKEDDKYIYFLLFLYANTVPHR